MTPSGETGERTRRAPWFQGWSVVAAALLAQGVSSGSTIYSYGVFIKPLAAEFQASRLATVLGLTVFSASMGLISPFVGRALDRGSIRALMVSGSLLLGAGFTLMGLGTALWQVGALYATAVAAGAALIGPLAGATLAANWFDRRRGQALGISAIGTSLGGFLIPPAAAFLIEALGWRSAFQVLGAGLAALLLPPIWLLVVSRPEDRGLQPDGSPPGDEAPGADPAEAPREWSTRMLLRDRSFWVIALSVGLVFSAFGAVMTVLVPLATDLGVSPQTASYLMSCLAAFGVIGKLVFGAAADRIDARRAFWTAMALSAASVALLLGIPGHGRMLVASAGLGLASGGLLPVWGTLIGLQFGRQAFGRVMGLMSPVMLPLTLTGIPFAGWVFDRTGGYSVAFGVFLGQFALAAVVLAALRPASPASPSRA